jgi:hypothetical protein
MKKRILPVLVILVLGLLVAGCDSLALESGGSVAAPLVAPRSVQVTALNESLMVNWTRIAAAQQYDPTYEVYYGEENPYPEEAHFWGTAVHDDSNLVSITIKELNNDTTYYVWVKAVWARPTIARRLTEYRCRRPKLRFPM